uniref:Uncharacterized protein n=1 Tax=Avena sativa TaxID=4498 RepID=A0ACD5X6W6_AVESA
MPRRERRVGTFYISDRNERGITFHKRRNGLNKGAADLSVLTGSRVSVVLEAENGNMHSFGTPSAKPIVGAFLSRTTPSVDEDEATKIALLQSEVVRLDMKNTTKDKKSEESVQHVNKVQGENPGMSANLVFTKEEDISLEDLHKLFNDLWWVKEDNRSRLPQLHHGQEANIGGQSMTRNMLPQGSISYDHLQTNPLWKQSAWSHHPPQQQMLPVPLTSPPEQTLTPHHAMKVPQILHTTPSTLEPPLTSLLQPISGPIHEIPLPQDLHLQNYPSPSIGQLPQNYVGPNITFKHNLEDSALLANSSVNYFPSDGLFGYDPLGYSI